MTLPVTHPVTHPVPLSSQLVAGRYHRLEVLLEESSRLVWRVRDEVHGEEKVLKGVIGSSDAQEVLGVRQEFERLYRLRHPMLPACFELATVVLPEHSARTGWLTFFTQELIRGTSLRAHLGKLSPSLLRPLTVELLSLLAWFHAQRQLGLDLKPDHIFLEGSRWRLIDLDQARHDDLLAHPEAVGAALYMAPEVLMRQAHEARSDVYALGRVLLEAVLGHLPPLPGDTLQSCGEQLLLQPVPALPASLEQADPALARVLKGLLTPELKQRPLADEALSWLEKHPRRLIPCPPPPFVSTDRLLESLVQHLKLPLREGKEGLGLRLVGPARAGRSRVLRELSCLLQLAGQPVFHLEAQRRTTAAGTLLTSLVKFLQALCRQAGMKEQVEELSPLHAVVTLSRTLADRCDFMPVILLDDVHTLDAQSSEQLQKLLPLLPETGLLLVLTELLAECAQKPTPYSGLETSALTPLGLSQLQQVSDAALGGGRLDATELHLLLTATGGISGDVQEALELLWHTPEQPVREVLQSWRPGDAAVFLAGVSRQLPPNALSLLHSLAILEGTFPESILPPLLSSLAIQGEALETALRQLLAGGWLERADGAEASTSRSRLLRFSQEHTRRRLAATLPESRRIQLHRMVAERLERQSPSGHALVSRQIAEHFIGGQQPERASSHLFMALKALEQSDAHGERLTCLKLLLSQLEGKEAGMDRAHV